MVMEVFVKSVLPCLRGVSKQPLLSSLMETTGNLVQLTVTNKQTKTKNQHKTSAVFLERVAPPPVEPHRAFPFESSLPTARPGSSSLPQMKYFGLSQQ